MPIDLQDVGTLGTLLARAVPLIKSLRQSKLSEQHGDELAELTDIVSDTSARLFALQTSLLSLQRENAELLAELTRLRAWDVEKSRFRLATPFPSCVVYALQKELSNGEPAHYLCATCYQKGEKSILQGRVPTQLKGAQGWSHAVYGCSVCKTDALTAWHNVPPPQYLEDIQTK